MKSFWIRFLSIVGWSKVPKCLRNRDAILYTCCTNPPQCFPSQPIIRSYSNALAVIRRPDTSDALLRAQDWLVRLPQLLATGITQQLDLLHDLERRQISYANWLLASVDIVSNNDGMFARAGRDGELDLGVGGGELGEEGLDEAAGQDTLAEVIQERTAIVPP